MSRAVVSFLGVVVLSSLAHAAPPVCMKDAQPPDFGESKASFVDGDAAVIHVCSNAAITNGTAKVIKNILQCFAVDRAKGTYSKWALPKAKPAGPKLSATRTNVKICDAAGGKCATLTPSRHAEDPLQVAVSEDGAAAVITVPGEQATYEIFDVKTKQRTALIDFKNGDRACGTARFVGDTVFVSAGVCAGPGANGFLYDRGGKLIAQLGGNGEDSPNSYAAAALQLDGTRWAFSLPYDNKLIIADVTTGKQEATVSLDKLNGPVTTGAPTYLMAKSSDGKLLVASGMASVAVLDPTSGAVLAAWTAPACAAAP